MSDANYSDNTNGGSFSPPDAFSNAGPSLGDLASMAGNFIGNLFSGGGGGGQAPSPVAQANATDAANAIVDPSTTAQTAIAGQPAPTLNQPQNPQGPQGQGQAANPGAPQSAVDQLKAALQALRQRQRQNPWQIGGAPNPANLPSPNATPATVQTVQPKGGGFVIPGYNAEGESNQPEYGPGSPQRNYPYPYEGDSNQPEYGDYKNPRQYPYEYEGESNQPEYGPGRDPAARAAGEGAVEGAVAPEELYPLGGSAPRGEMSYGPGRSPTPPSYPDELFTARPNETFQAGQPIPGAGGPSLAGLASRLLPGSLLARTAMALLHPSPTQSTEPGVVAPSTGDEFPPPEAPIQEEGDPFPYDPRGGAGGREITKFEKPAETKAPATGKPIKTVNPKTGKPVDPKTGDPLPTRKGPPGEYQPTPGNARQPRWVSGGPDDKSLPPPYGGGPPEQGPIMRDVRGGQGVPPMLGQIAQMALPLLMQGLMSGAFGGGGRFGHRGFGRFGRGGYWPFHHPSFGWRVHGYHPGGGWRPLDPRHMLGNMGGGLGQGPFNLGGGGQGGGGNGQGPLGYTEPPSYDPNYDKVRRYQNPGEPSPTAIGKGPDGQQLPYTGEEAADFTDEVASKLGIDQATARKVLAGESTYGQNYTNRYERDGIPSYGPFQLHNSGPGSVGYEFERATGEKASDPNTWKDQIVFALRWAAQHGWGPWGAATKAGLSQWAGISGRGKVAAFAWDYGQPHGGVTATGGDTKPNPDGNTAKDDTSKPLYLDPIPENKETAYN